MKNKIGIIILFTFQALAIPFSLIAGFMLAFSVVSILTMGLFGTGEVIQSVVALITMIIGSLYTGTYAFSLIKTRINGKISFVSWLPFFHGIIALGAVLLWNYVDLLYR